MKERGCDKKNFAGGSISAKGVVRWKFSMKVKRAREKRVPCHISIRLEQEVREVT